MNSILYESGRHLPLGLLLPMVLAPAAAAADQAAEALLKAQAKVLATEAAKPAPEGPVMTVERPVAEPTLPRGKLPQYQLGYQQRSSSGRRAPDEAPVRLLLLLLDRTLLLEAAITIDGRPFRERRREWVEKVLAESGRPETSEERDPPAVDTPPKGEAPAEEAPSPEASEPAGETDAGETDAGEADVGEADVGETDAGETDAGEADVGEETAAAVDAEADVEQDELEEQSEVAEPREPVYALPRTPVEFLRRYRERLQRPVTVAEAQWLLDERLAGPAFIQLKDYYQRFRAPERPLCVVLDRDRNGLISESEREQAVASVEACDRNRDGVVDFTEIEAAANDGAGAEVALPPVLAIVLDDPPNCTAAAQRALDWYAARRADAKMHERVRRHLDTDKNGRFDDADWQRLADAQPDLRVAVEFVTEQPDASTIRVTDYDSERLELRPDTRFSFARPGAILLLAGHTPIELSAVVGGASDQVSAGAVVDGYPLLPAVDPGDDGRLTLRDLRRLPAFLTAFDQDGDGSLSEAETRAPVRVCFGRGAVVHRELAQIRSVHPPRELTPAAPPVWFTRMDRNKDGDVSRSEFPGTDEQFDQLDADRDGLVSVQEADDYE